MCVSFCDDLTLWKDVTVSLFYDKFKNSKTLFPLTLKDLNMSKDIALTIVQVLGPITAIILSFLFIGIISVMYVSRERRKPEDDKEIKWMVIWRNLWIIIYFSITITIYIFMFYMVFKDNKILNYCQIYLLKGSWQAISMIVVSISLLACRSILMEKKAKLITTKWIQSCLSV